MSVSKRFLKIFLFFFLALSMNSSCDTTSPWGYSIFYGDGSVSEKWGEYLFKHLSKRSKKGERIVLLAEEKPQYRKIKVEVNKKLGYDYCIEQSDEQLILKAKSESTMLWLIYQLISDLSATDDRIVANDLPPAIIEFKPVCANFDFVYREPHFHPNLDIEYAPIIGTNEIEKDWGIWGHNLGSVLQKGSGNYIYARQNGNVDINQFCFSSEELYRQLEEHIHDNFEEKGNTTHRFMIMPNDNTIACDCELCKDRGNTPGNATPAVSFLIKRLAQRFPNQIFFTSAYLTTKYPPKDRWPDNTGIMISTIDLPKGVALENQKEIDPFLTTLANWRKATQNIYIWDYASNFDDYLTPIPVLYGLKKQLAFYKEHGVKGVFLNASGYDYTPFEDMKTYVAAALMMDCTLSVDDLCTKYFKRFYPKAGDVLSSYYLSLEKKLEKTNRPYNMYGGFKEAMKNYLDPADFVSFFNSIKSIIPTAGEDEKEKLEKMYAALCYTRLQVAYYLRNGDYGYVKINDKELTLNPEIKPVLEKLSQYKDFGLKGYKEAGGEIGIYLNNWNRILGKLPFKNLLLDEPIKLLSKPDEGYRQIDVLDNGVLGFFKEYHQGWILSSDDDLEVQFSAQNLKQAKKIVMTFLINERHRINIPSKIEIYKNGSIYKDLKYKEEDSEIAVYETDVDFSNAESIKIRAYRNRNSIACDEIQIY